MYPMTQAVLDRVSIYSPGRLRSFFFFMQEMFAHLIFATWPSGQAIENFLRVLIFAAQATDENFFNGENFLIYGI